MSATSIGQANVIRMLLKANPRLHQEFFDATSRLLSSHGVVLERDTALGLTLAVDDEFVVGAVHVIFSEDIEDAKHLEP